MTRPAVHAMCSRLSKTQRDALRSVMDEEELLMLEAVIRYVLANFALLFC